MPTRNRRDGGTDVLLRTAGSLWLAVVLLVLILLAMACATVYESAHGTDRALAAFYKAWWFRSLLALLAINVLAAVLVRYPFSRRQVGFVLTHFSILVVLAGALVTQYVGIEGQVGVMEGQTVEHMNVHRDTLTIARNDGGTRHTADLSDSAFGGFQSVEQPSAPALTVDDLRFEVARYLPDSTDTERVVNDSPHPHPALEISLFDPHGHGEPSVWVFANRTARLGHSEVLFRLVESEDELRELLETQPPETADASPGTVRVDYQESTFEFPVEDCMEQAVAVGQTGYTLRVLRYLPHAIVGSDNQLRSASDQPINPTIEVELTGPEGTVKRPAFAKFPDFWSTHGSKVPTELKVTFVANKSAAPSSPIEIIGGPGEKLHVRFAREGEKASAQELTIGTPCDTPWAGFRFTVRRRFENARVERTIAPVDPARQDRVPAVLLEVQSPTGTQTVWLQKYRPRSLTLGGAVYDLVYAEKQVPLGFSITLDRFTIGHYPGTMRPRSFESQVTILDPTTGRKTTRVISMNHPTTFGGYTFYQSSYRQEEGQTASFLSVSWDPGQPVTFAGYAGMLIGMLIVLGQRVGDRRRRESLTAGVDPEDNRSGAEPDSSGSLTENP